MSLHTKPVNACEIEIGTGKTQKTVKHPGMTYREYLVGLIVSGAAEYASSYSDDTIERRAKFAVRYADEIIKQMESE